MVDRSYRIVFKLDPCCSVYAAGVLVMTATTVQCFLGEDSKVDMKMKFNKKVSVQLFLCQTEEGCTALLWTFAQ